MEHSRFFTALRALLQTPEVAANRRIACAVSGGLVVVAAVAALLAVIVLGKLVIWLLTFSAVVNTVWAVFALAVAALLIFFTVWVLPPRVDAARIQLVETNSRLKREWREREQFDWGDFASAVWWVMRWPLGIAALLGLDAALTWAWVVHPAFVPAKDSPTDYGDIVFSFIFLQTVLTAMIVIVWMMLDNRKHPTAWTRIWTSALCAQIPLWFTHLKWFFMSHAGLNLGFAAMAAGLCGLPLVGLLLGAAYSCEENLFDRLGLRY